MSPAPFNVPAVWSNQPLILYHGTLQQHRASLVHGITPSRGRSNTDFGTGFHTTTSLIQAKSWAWQAAEVAKLGGNPTAAGCVLAYRLDREQAAGLESLSFIRGDRDAADFWSLVFHCRQGLAGHGRPGAKAFYDLVYGPVASFWQQRVAMSDADQISIHTSSAARLLIPDSSRNVDV
jgi:hypothetical protein